MYKRAIICAVLETILNKKIIYLEAQSVTSESGTKQLCRGYSKEASLDNLFKGSLLACDN